MDSVDSDAHKLSDAVKESVVAANVAASTVAKSLEDGGDTVKKLTDSSDAANGSSQNHHSTESNGHSERCAPLDDQCATDECTESTPDVADNSVASDAASPAVEPIAETPVAADNETAAPAADAADAATAACDGDDADAADAADGDDADAASADGDDAANTNSNDDDDEKNMADNDDDDGDGGGNDDNTAADAQQNQHTSPSVSPSKLDDSGTPAGGSGRQRRQVTRLGSTTSASTSATDHLSANSPSSASGATASAAAGEGGSRRSSGVSTAVGAGRGDRLDQFSVIMTRMKKVDSENLHALHRVLYGRPGRSFEYLRNIRQFNGFAFDQDSPEYNNKVQSLSRYIMSVLRVFADCLNISRNKGCSREQLVPLIMDFLMQPKLSDQQPEVSKTSAKKAKKSQRKPKSTTTTQSSPKKSSKSPAAKSASKKPAAAAVATTSTRKRKLNADTEDTASVNKKQKKSPTDGELRALVKRLLAGADLEQVTMKNILTQVYAKYPGHDLTVRKDFIKTVVKSLIS